MGKEMSKKNVRVSKRKSSCSNSTSHANENFNHSVKVLKPRVYITDVSDFKSLVQKLTGNGITIPPQIPILSQSSMSSIILQPSDDQQVQIMQNNIIVDQDCYSGFQESSPEWSFERSCSEIIDVPLTTFDSWNISEVGEMSTKNFNNDMIDEFHSSLFGSHDMSLVRYGDEVEYSWIAEMNNHFNYNHEAPIMPAEVCEYAYDLSEML